MLYYLTSARGHAQLTLDVWTANYESWHMVTTGHPWIDGLRVPHLYHNPLQGVWVRHAVNGHTVIGRAPGVVAVTLPAYWLAHPDSMTLVPAGVTASILVAGGLTLMYLALDKHLPRRWALLSVLALGFTTPVWSVAADGVWPHTVMVFGIGGMAWAAANNRWWAVGLFGGIALWARLHAALIVAVLGVGVGWRRRDARIIVRSATTSLGMLVLMLPWVHWMYGTWNPTGSYDSTTLQGHAAASWHSPVNWLGFWVSPDRGVLVWTPVLLLLVPALVRSWRDLPDWSQSLLVGGVVYSLLQVALNSFTGGDIFYGYRYAIALVGCATPALGFSAPRTGRSARLLVPPLLVVQLLAIALGASTNKFLLPESEVWHANAFLSALERLGAGAWTITGSFLVVGLALGFRWQSHRQSERAEPSASTG